MASIFDKDNFPKFKEQLDRSIEMDKEQREQARICIDFVTKEDGQWEDEVSEIFSDTDRPRYTFDRVTPIIDMMVGELEHSKFGPRVLPDGKGADKKVAELRNGIIRGVLNRSKFDFMSKRIARKMIVAGYDSVRVRHDYIDNMSFDQDLIVEYIPNSIDRVFYDPNSIEQDRSDAEWVVVLQNVSEQSFKDTFGEDAQLPSSIDNGRISSSTDQAAVGDFMIGEAIYIKYETKEIAQLSTGDVIEKDKLDEYMKKFEGSPVMVGIRRTRKVKMPKVYTRFFDANGWLDKEIETAFRMLPVVPFYHCFDIVDERVVWKRIVGKLMDAQRVFNYARSRMVEKVALSPAEKIAMSIDQLEGVEDAMDSLNVDIDPLFIYNHVDGQPAPYKLTSNQVDQALMLTAQEAAGDIEAIAGMYAASMAKNPGMQSGVAIEKQVERGEIGNTGIWVDVAMGVTRLCQIINDTIPNIADTARSMQAVYEDGTTEFVNVNSDIYDQETREIRTENDMQKGKYAVICRMGPMYTTQQGETRAALNELYATMPELPGMTADIYASTIDAPGMDQVHERLRMQMIANGMIPQNQFTEEEKAAMEQAEAAMAEQQQAAPAAADPIQALMEGQLTVEQFKAQMDAVVQQAEVKVKEADARKKNAEAEAQEIENQMTENKVLDMLEEVYGNGATIEGYPAAE